MARKKKFKNLEKDSLTAEGMSAGFVAQELERTQIAKYHTKGGHGFVAEDANNFADKIRGRDAEVIGVSNELNGADRVIDGIAVQSKYYRSASETVLSAFESSGGNYKYGNQLLEVPKDQYEDCIAFMRKRIAEGRVPGFDNPADAEKLVKQGTVTYQQARNFARAGNIDSLVFDVKTQSVTSAYVMAVSFAVVFAQGCMRGEEKLEATRSAMLTSLTAGVSTLVTGVITAQVLRTKAAAIGAVAMRNGVRSVSQTAVGKEAIHRIAAGSLGRAVYGSAAVNHVSKLMRSNMVTASIAAAVTCAPDFYRAAFSRSISWKQFTKNTTVNIAGVAGGTAGWIGGAAVGAAAGSVVPGVGTVVCGFVGGIAGAVAGGVGASAASRKVANKLVEDDSAPFLRMFEEEFKLLASEFLLVEDEIEAISKVAQKKVKPKWLRRMFKECRKDRSEETARAFVRAEMEPEFEKLVAKRLAISLPEVSVLAEQMDELIGELPEVC